MSVDMPSIHPLVLESQQPTPRIGPCANLVGTIKAQPEDFCVEEIPAYLPSGEGDHLFLWLEKRNVPAFALVDALARILEVDAGDIGVAGMKDARAVTKQWVSVPSSAEGLLQQDGKDKLAAEGIWVLQALRHGNKLKTGHLRANQFDVVVRDIPLDGDALDAQIATWLEQTRRFGVLNAFGQQRFGHHGATVALGLGVLGVEGVRRAPRLSKGKLRLALSAVQSALFNAFVRERLRTDSIYRVQRGDVAMVCASGGPFVVEDPDEVNARLQSREAVLSGPMYGPKMRTAAWESEQQEAGLMARYRLSPSDFVPFAKLAQGTRRACVLWPENVSALRCAQNSMRVQFTLPSGSYATELLGQWLALSDSARGS